jgi:hypothetical protein
MKIHWEISRTRSEEPGFRRPRFSGCQVYQYRKNAQCSYVIDGLELQPFLPPFAMRRSTSLLISIVTVAALAFRARAQDHLSNLPFTSNVRLVTIPREVQILRYSEGKRTTTVKLIGTALAPKAEGHATIETASGDIKIEAHIRGLKPAENMDPEKLTYVLWAVTVRGEVINLGEFVIKKGDATLITSTNLRSFAMMITAEPYFAVTVPSEWIVLYNVLPDHQDQDKIRADLLPIHPNAKAPLDVFEARNAVRIARLAGAERYAAETFHKAVELLEQAETIANRANRGTPEVEESARKATEAAEESRSKAVQHQRETTSR